MIWLLFTQTGSLWVAWTKEYLLKNGSYWDTKEGVAGSWAWRKLLKIRPLAYDYIRHEVKDGRSVSFWFDNWLGVGKLLDVTGELGTRYLGVARQATVADVATESGWRIRSRGCRNFPDIYGKINAFSLPSPLAGTYKVLWRHNQDEFKESFHSASTWNQLRSKRELVAWRKLVWFSQAVPRHSFMVWLTLRNRLSTGDRLRSWGITQICMLCGEPNETREHLYFACPYSFYGVDIYSREFTGQCYHT